MQELVILISSIAGACTAAAVKKFPRNKTEIISLGANSKIKNQINSLKIEKDVLTKTISRLYQQSGSEISRITHDKLLLRYQHQLGIIITKIEKLEAASNHPDLGPVGEGLITLMDQKLSKLDQRFNDLSAKISFASTHLLKPSRDSTRFKEETSENKIEAKISSQRKDEIKKSKLQETDKPSEKLIVPPLVVGQVSSKTFKPVEITTLTELPEEKPQEIPFIETTKPVSPKEEIMKEYVPPRQETDDPERTFGGSISSQSFPQAKIPSENPQIFPQLPVQDIHPKLVENKPVPKVNVPEEQFDEEDMDDDLDKIKGEIMKTLSKLEQVEVE